VTDGSRRTPTALHHEASWHEAGHAVAAYLVGTPIDKIVVRTEQGALLEGRFAGSVYLAREEPKDVHEAEDRILVLLAGTACVRVAWSIGTLSDEFLGRVEPSKELTVDDLLVSRNGSTPAGAAAYVGLNDERDSPDDQDAQALAQEWTGDTLEAASMLGYLRARTINVVQGERFQSLASTIAAALLEHGELDGDLATHLLDRANAVFAPARTEGGNDGSNAET
jgi:hypothetical protein